MKVGAKREKALFFSDQAEGPKVHALNTVWGRPHPFTTLSAYSEGKQSLLIFHRPGNSIRRCRLSQETPPPIPRSGTSNVSCRISIVCLSPDHVLYMYQHVCMLLSSAAAAASFSLYLTIQSKCIEEEGWVVNALIQWISDGSLYPWTEKV